MSDAAAPAVVVTPAAPPPPPTVAPVVIPAVTELADKYASQYVPKDRASSLQTDKAEFAALMAAADQAIDAMGAAGTEPAAAVVPQAPATQAPAAPTVAPAAVTEAAKPKTLDDPPATTEAPKTLGEPAPIRPLSLRERQLEKQTREPLEQQLAKIRQDHEAAQQQHKSFQDNIQQLYRAGRVDEAARMAFGVGLTDLQRADLQARGAVQQKPPENPETAELRARLERFEQTQAQQAKAQAEAQHRAALQRQEEADLRDVTTEMEASGYEDVKRLAKLNGAAKMVAESIKANPHLDTEHHWRAAKQRFTSIADHVIEQLYPHLVPYLKGGVPPVSQQTGVSPAQAGVSPAARPVAQSGVMPVQPSAPAAPIALPQDNSADAGQRKFSSDKEEWDALLASMGIER